MPYNQNFACFFCTNINYISDILHPSFYFSRIFESFDYFYCINHFSLDIIKIVVCKPLIFFWTVAYIAQAGAVNTSGTKVLLANGLEIFLVMAYHFLAMVQNVYQKMYLIALFFYDHWVFDSSILVDKIFTKTLWKLGTCLLAVIYMKS